MVITTKNIEFSLVDVVVHADEKKEEAQETIEEVEETIEEHEEGDLDLPDEIIESYREAQQTVSQQKEIINRTLEEIENQWETPEDADEDMLVFTELSTGNSIDISVQGGDEGDVMDRYLSEMVDETPECFPDDITDLPMSIGEGIFNCLDGRLEEGNVDLQVSQIRSQ